MGWMKLHDNSLIIMAVCNTQDCTTGNELHDYPLFFFFSQPLTLYHSLHTNLSLLKALSKLVCIRSQVMSQLLSQTEINGVHLQFLLNPTKHMQCLQVTHCSYFTSLGSSKNLNYRCPNLIPPASPVSLLRQSLETSDTSFCKSIIKLPKPNTVSVVPPS